MSALQGTIKNGQIILDAPAALPEGTRVEVLPIEEARPTLGMREEDWPTTTRGSQRCWLGWTRSSRGGSRRKTTPPGGRRYAQKEFEKARFFEDAEKLRRMWE